MDEENMKYKVNWSYNDTKSYKNQLLMQSKNKRKNDIRNIEVTF